MTLDEFKRIWYMECTWCHALAHSSSHLVALFLTPVPLTGAHRTWGRTIGVVFTVPMVVFAARGYLPKPILPRIGAMLGLGAFQGFVGWWMVRSGLQEPDPEAWTPPRVSPYRLAAHVRCARGFCVTHSMQ